jgi:hypothetical protein
VVTDTQSTAYFGSGSHIGDSTNTNTTFLVQSALYSKGHCTQSMPHVSQTAEQLTAIHLLNSCTVMFQHCVTQLVNPHNSHRQTATPRIITRYNRPAQDHCQQTDRQYHVSNVWRSGMTTPHHTIQYLFTVAVEAAGSVLLAAFQRLTSNITRASDHSGHSRFQASTTKQLITALFWVVTQRVMVISYRCFGTPYRSHRQGSSEDGTDRLSRNVGQKIQIIAA